MSISTGSICSFGDYASSSKSSMSGKVINDPDIHEDTLRAAQLPGWCNEIHGKICFYDGDIGSYLRTFVPSRTPWPLDAPATALGLELTSGASLVRPGHVARFVRPLKFYSSMFSELWSQSSRTTRNPPSMEATTRSSPSRSPSSPADTTNPSRTS